MHRPSLSARSVTWSGPSADVVKALDVALDADGALLATWEFGAKPRRLVQRRHDITETLLPLTAPAAPTDPPLIDVLAVRTMAQTLQAADRQVGGG